MKENIIDFVYLSTKTYISLRQFKKMIYAFGFFSLLIFGISMALENQMLMIAAISFFCAYGIFVAIINSNHVKKTFQLRFLTNGIAAVFLLYFAVLFLSTVLLLEPKLTGYLLPISIAYLLFLVLFFTVIFT